MLIGSDCISEVRPTVELEAGHIGESESSSMLSFYLHFMHWDNSPILQRTIHICITLILFLKAVLKCKRRSCLNQHVLFIAHFNSVV